MLNVDVAIVGGGFGGSLMSLVLHRAGLSVALIDRGHHPRFAIGESSTPIANLVLGDLCQEYDLPRLAPLTKYGSWQTAYPELGCGIKRGFSYFQQTDGQPFSTDAGHSSELLVAASSSDQHSDTHWLRQDVDQFLFNEARSAGVFCFEDCDVVDLESCADGVVLELASSRVRARFVIDASGEGGFLAKRLKIEDRTHEMRTNSRAVFAHFSGVTRWRDILTSRIISPADHPFDCDHAALHHVFDGGWMWQLRFHDETVSAGFVQDCSPGARFVHDSPSGLNAADEWNLWLDRFPAIAEQFSTSNVVRPERGLCATKRLQRKLARVAGPWWALLPNSAGFVDPLHSTGIAQTLCGIERLARVLIQSLGREELETRLRDYECCVLAELDLIDQMVSSCFAAMGDFSKFVAASMLYFAAATSYERSRLTSASDYSSAFLLADDPGMQCLVRQMRERSLVVADAKQFAGELADAIRPYNLVGLCDPAVNNMYRRSALPE